jgi:hypothetical protein
VGGIYPRLRVLSLAAALALALSLGAARADASTTLGSPDTSAVPDGFACAKCPAGTSVAFTQFALREAAVEAPEDGVLVAASVHARWIAGTEPPRIAVLRPDEDAGVGVRVVESAPLPVSLASGSLHEVEGLRLPVRKGRLSWLPVPDGRGRCRRKDAIPARRRHPVLLAAVRPLRDGRWDRQRAPARRARRTRRGPGRAGRRVAGSRRRRLGLDWEEDWFEDFEEGDELDHDLDADASPRERRQIRLLDVDRIRGGRGSLLLRVQRAGRVSAAVTLPANRRTGAGPFQTILTGEMRVSRAGRVRLPLATTPPGARVSAAAGGCARRSS